VSCMTNVLHPGMSTTESRRPSGVVRVLPSLTDVAFLMPIILLFARLDGAKTMLGDGDTGWHIRTGEWILANGAVPHQDIFSFSKPGATWYAWEWLWDVCFAWLFQHGGLANVVAVSVLIIALTFALLFRLVQRHCENPLIAIGATVLACAQSSLHWLARPHLVTMLFLVVFLMVLDRVREGRRRLLLVMPLLTVLWTNLHGGFLAGILVLGAFAAGELTGAILAAGKNARGPALSRSRDYALTAAACAAASLVNPYGYQLHVHIYRYLSDPYQFRYINEFLSISFQNPVAGFFEVMLALGVAVTVWNIAHRRFTPAFLILGWAHLALISSRNIPLFGIVAAPLVASGMDQALRNLRQADVAGWVKRTFASFGEIGGEVAVVEKHWRVHAVSVMVTLLLAGALHASVSSNKFRAEYDPKRYPAKALDAIVAGGFAKHIFTDDEWGDYLIFRLYPAHKVFIDGRSDFYGASFGEKYLDVMNVKYDWEQYLRKYDIDTILLATTSPLAGAIKESRRWRPVYDDTIAIIFRPVGDYATEEQGFSTAVPGGKDRDPRITIAVPSDPEITKRKQLKGDKT
jgi:hypothetical protein